MTVEIIPIKDAGTNGAFYFTVALDGVTFEISFQHNSREDRWYFDIQDLDGNVIRSSVKAIINWPSLRLDVSAERPAGELMFIDTRSEPSNPGIDDLGENVVFGYVPEADI